MTDRVLVVDELIAAARAKTGRADLGDEWFREPLGVLVDALNTEAGVSELGFTMTSGRLVGLLADRLRRLDLVERNPEILDEQVDVAAVICGLPRTGSTLLHRLLAASPQLTATASWETSYPLPFPGEGRGEGAERQRRAKERMEAFLALSPEFAGIHTVSWDQPEEDVIVVDRSFTSMSFDSFYWVPSYGIWLRSYDQAPAYAELVQWLQILQWQAPSRAGRRWVLKSPHHLTAAGTVLDTFPGSKIVMTHRSPVSAVPSYASMVASMTAQYAESIDKAAIGGYWNDRFRETLLEKFAPLRQARPDRFVDVAFSAVQDDALGEARRVFAELGVDWTPQDATALEAYLERNAEERHGGGHAYTAEEFGLSKDQLARDFAPYMEVYL